MVSGNSSYTKNYEGETERRSSSAQIKSAWNNIKSSMKEHHQGLNAAYELYYGPYRVQPQAQSERRLS